MVTGGAGFIGSHVVDAYIDKGYDVVIVDDLSSGRLENINPKAKFYQVDVGDRTALERIFSIEQPQFVNHHAAQISVDASVKDPIMDATTNILGTLTLLELSRLCGAHKFIFASTGGAIYDERYIPANEEAPLAPKSPYGIAKFSSEKYIRFYNEVYGLSYVILRYSNVYGSRQIPKGENSVVPIFIEKIRSGRETVIFGDGCQTRDFVHVSDVARANLLASSGDFIGALNISSGIETSINELLQLLQATAGTSFAPLYQPAKPGELRRSVLNNSAALDRLGWKPKIWLAEGLKPLIG